MVFVLSFLRLKKALVLIFTLFFMSAFAFAQADQDRQDTHDK